MRYIYLLLILSTIFANYDSHDSWCGTIHQGQRDFERFEYMYPQFIDGDHFRVHFTTEASDSLYWNDTWMTHQSTIVYATTVLEQSEFAYSVYENNDWEMPPIDCDESITDITNPGHCNNYGGNSLYDIYIGLVEGPAAAVVPENPNYSLPYLGGLSSYMLFANGLGLYGSNDDLASINYYIVAHELHHAIEFSYGSYITGSPGNYVFHSWMLEQTATYMENIVYPDAMHLRLLLSNCNIETPLTNPQLGIFQSYPGALWQKFLVNYLNDQTLIRHVWESYGTRISNAEDSITFFDIFNDEIMASSDNLFNLESMYKEYSIWRYFTGDRAISNEYFNQASLYCTSTTMQMSENIQLQAELGGNRYIEIPNDNIIVYLEAEYINSAPAVLIKIQDNDDITFSNLELLIGNNLINIDNQFNGEHILIVLSGYTGNELNFDNLVISIDINSSTFEGDINNDEIVNILDIVQLVNLVLNNEYQVSGDINSDNLLNVIDVVLLVNIILNN